MALNKNITTNQRSLGKAILSLFIGIVITSCAGTDSSVQKKGEENPNLVKAGTPTADSLAEGMPEFARSVFKGTLDSVPGECYYHVTNGRIDALLQKEGNQYKNIAYIIYDSPNEQNSYELRTDNSRYKVKNAVLAVEEVFPNYFKEYWNNGKIKSTAKGLLYRDNQGVVKVDSGRSEIYFESGKIKELNGWKDKQGITSKQWNENGVLIKDLDFPRSCTEYWDNGKIKQKLEGIIYKDDQDIIRVDSGHSEIYFENGKIKERNDWNGKLLIAQKEWDEKGTLIKEFAFPKYFKEYWNNGKIKQIGTGLLYRGDQGNLQVDSGHSEIYYENGKIKEQNDWKDKLPVTHKLWNENGILVAELDFPKNFKGYWDNGNLKNILTGVLYRDDQDDFALDSGHSEIYYENGKIKEQNDWKDKLPVAHKLWNENGVLIKEFIFPKYYKEYWNNGKIKGIMTGVLYRDDQGNFVLDSGISKEYSENGKMLVQKGWKNKQVVLCKQWNEKGVLIKDINFPKYFKEYYDNGKIKENGTGLLYRDDQGVFKMDSGHSEIYSKSGKKIEQNDWKDKLVITHKQWNEKGVLIKELSFPKYTKEYYDNGKIKSEMTGLLYWNTPTDLEIENGSKKEYYENGKIKLQTDWKDKQGIAQKEWDENGSLTVEWDIPTSHLKSYNENGTIYLEINGYTGQTDTLVENGYLTMYFDNGKPQIQIQYKEKKDIGKKAWHENGTLMMEEDLLKGFHKEFFENGNMSREILGKFHYDDNKMILENASEKRWYENGNLQSEIVFPKYAKKYFNNGAPNTELKGTLYYDDQGTIQVKEGFRKEYYENGRMLGSANYKEKKKVNAKVWHENGTLKLELDFPKYEKVYSEKGTPIMELEGTLYYDDQGKIQVQDGFQKLYYENGRMMGVVNYKEKKEVSKKSWKENGNLVYEFAFPKYEKTYSEKGTPIMELEGTLYYDDQDKIQVQNGVQKVYYENGQLMGVINYKEKKEVGKKSWHENGNLIFELVFPKYEKVYSENGNIFAELEGTLYYDDQNKIRVQDGFEKVYYENKKVASHKIYKEKRLVGKTEWYKNGNMSISVELPKRYREFYDNEKIKVEASGTIVEENESFKIKDGIYKEYSPSGEVTYSATYKDFQIISEKK
ncbi:hypothetical protein J5681_04785 [bacterium]|nr:hypothetical protein [bacterium]